MLTSIDLSFSLLRMFNSCEKGLGYTSNPPSVSSRGSIPVVTASLHGGPTLARNTSSEPLLMMVSLSKTAMGGPEPATKSPAMMGLFLKVAIELLTASALLNVEPFAHRELPVLSYFAINRSSLISVVVQNVMASL